MALMLTDRQLVALSCSGDVEAFGVLVDRHRLLALRLAYAIVGDEAEDAVQDAFLKAFRKLKSFRAELEFAPWLYTIVLNESRNRRRSLTRRRRLELKVQPHNENVESAEDSASLEMERQRVCAAVARLGERDREIVALRFFLGLSEAESALAIGRPAGTAKSRLSRALGRLQDIMEGEVDAG